MPSSSGTHIPEDIARLIFDEILIDGDNTAFCTAALISSTFLYVAQCHLYRSFTLRLRDPRALQDLKRFLDIIDRRPYIGSLVKDVTIIDNAPSERVSQHVTIVDNHVHHASPLLFPSEDASAYLQSPLFTDLFITNTENILPRLFTAFSALSSTSVIFQGSPLNWSALHPDVRNVMETSVLFPSSQLNSVCLVGVVNIPGARASGLLRRAELELDHCHFETGSPSFDRRRYQRPTHRTSHCIEQFRIVGAAFAGFPNLLETWASSMVALPRVKALSLAVNGWCAIDDVVSILHVFGHGVEELTLSTEQLELRYIQQQPPPDPSAWPFSHQHRLPRMRSHAKGDCLSTGDLDDPHVGTLARQLRTTSIPASSGTTWFANILSPLRPSCHPPLGNLRKLKFEISHWRSALDVYANGELFWVVSYLAELPFSGAQSIEELAIAIDVGTDFCLDNPEAVEELAHYQGWLLLDLALTDPSWKALKEVQVAIRSRISCNCGAEEQLNCLIEGLKVCRLPRLNACGILDVQFIPLRT